MQQCNCYNSYKYRDECVICGQPWDQGIEKGDLVLNRIKTPDGTILTSYSQHDYKTHDDNNGETYMVDGGTAYVRRSINIEPYQSLDVYSTAPFDVLREAYYWGTYGINGDQPLSYVALADMDTDHIKAVLRTQSIKSDRKLVMEKELVLREDQ